MLDDFYRLVVSYLFSEAIGNRLTALFSHKEHVNIQAADSSKINIRRGEIHDVGRI